MVESGTYQAAAVVVLILKLWLHVVARVIHACVVQSKPYVMYQLIQHQGAPLAYANSYLLTAGCKAR